ncbi:MAG: Fpg/Nei family glycosylase [Microbacteriaceae bacterium]|nr:Fpg/Nei family glycosylase [Microbacteriaceae bacterium]
MPELPEVHALVADLGARLIGRTVDRLDVVSFAALKTFDPPASRLSGGTITSVSRHGKFLDVAIDTVAIDPVGTDAANASVGTTLHLVLHLAKAGWIRWREGEPPPPSRSGKGPLAARLVLAAGRDRGGRDTSAGSGLDVTEAGTKKSLAIYLVTDPRAVPGIARLGPDPLDPGFTVETLAAILASAGRAQVKGVLRNQSLIAGIGNAYSDEILHVAKMSPFKPAAMTQHEIERLFDAMLGTLTGAVARADGLAASELKREKKSGMRVHGRTGEACPVCGDTVREVIFADSTLQYCPTCQTNGKPLADRVLSRLLK